MLLDTYNTRPQVVVVGFMDYSISKIYCHYYLTSIDFFFRFRIDAITLFAIPAQGPHGFHALGRYVRAFSTLESCVNYNHPQNRRIDASDHEQPTRTPARLVLFLYHDWPSEIPENRILPTIRHLD